MPTKTLIVDLGAVLYAIDVPRGMQAMKDLMPQNRLEKLPSNQDLIQLPLFVDFERGILSAEEFRAGLRQMGVAGSDAELNAAWNSVLLHPIPDRAMWLQRLGEHFRLFLLSNTNVIHWKRLAPEATEILSCFEHLYLSFEMGLSKPDPRIYEAVLEEQGLERQSCIFLDDSQANVESALSIGLPAVQIEGVGGKNFEEFSRQLLTSAS